MLEVAKYINDTEPDINHGGCCIFAEAMVEALGVLGYKADAAVIGAHRLSPNIDEVRPLVVNRSSVAEWEMHGIDMEHIIVRVHTEGGWKYLDSHGFGPEVTAKQYGMHMAHGHLTLEDLQLLSKAPAGPGGWNDEFPVRHRNRVHDYVVKAMTKGIES